MNILIFGVTGNCGKAAAKEFVSKNNKVYGVARSEQKPDIPELEYIRGDIMDKLLFEKLPKNIDTVINFAGVQPSILSTSERTDLTTTLDAYVKVNIDGVFNVLEYCRNTGVKKYIYTTTHRDYENYWSNERYLENNLPPSINYKGDHAMYAISKTSAKMMGDYYREAFGLKVFNLRLPMIFLVPDKPYYLVDGKKTMMPFLRIICSAIRGDDLEIWGNKDMVRDYVHIRNLLNLIDSCAVSDLDGGTFNVGTGEAVTTERFVKEIARVFGPDNKKIAFKYLPEKRTYKCAIYNIEQERKLLSYEPVLLAEMLELMKKELSEKGVIQKWCRQ